MFIDQDADRGTSNEAIRVHVMRESHRARRQLRGLMQPSENHGQMTFLPSVTPPLLRRQETSRETSEDNSAGQSPNRVADGAKRESQVETADTTELRRLAQERLTSLFTTTSVAITDMTPGVQILRSLPADIIDLCDNDTAALHALLALISTIQTSVSVLQAAQHESSALETLRSRLAVTSSTQHSNVTITTVLLLSMLEVSLPALVYTEKPHTDSYSAPAQTKKQLASTKQHYQAWFRREAVSRA